MRIFLPRESLAREYLCRVCGDRFSDQRHFEVHAGACARARLPELLAEREAYKDRNPLAFSHPDPEVEQHMLEVGERMLREGRLTVRPSERAGF